MSKNKVGRVDFLRFLVKFQPVRDGVYPTTMGQASNAAKSSDLLPLFVWYNHSESFLN
ncbi:MAG: hypothetical protein F6K26_00400 [Moorea sp. SIO2I5]|nr:hypothetical protein [Moorena sp. SIO2I5]